MSSLRDAFKKLFKGKPELREDGNGATKKDPSLDNARVAPVTTAEIRAQFRSVPESGVANPNSRRPGEASPVRGPTVAPSVSKAPVLPVAAAARARAVTRRTFDRAGLDLRGPAWKSPEPWVSEGTAVQPRIGGSGRTLSVRLGIDFGTAYTKVAVRAADAVQVVDWTGVQEADQKWMVPSLLSVLDDGTCCIGERPGARAVIGGLKQPLIEGNESQLTGEQVAYIACALRYARAWFFKQFAGILANRQVIWSINLGIPAESWADKKTVQRYLRLGNAAWAVSTAPGAVSISDSLSAFEQSRRDPLVSIETVPEFLAEIASYIQSPHRKDGLHMLVDVGGGTVDIAAFNVYHNPHEERDRFPIFDCQVKPLGAHFLMKRRIAAARVQDLDWNDPWSVPSSTEFANRLTPPLDNANALDQSVVDDVARSVYEVLYKTRMRRYKAAPEWRSGIPIFLTGGGSHVDAYREAVRKGCSRLPVAPILLDLPSSLNGQGQAPAGVDELRGRLAVACGLTFDIESTGLVLAPADVPNDSTKPARRRERPDRDDLYPK
jgi:hypothetical protein